MKYRTDIAYEAIQSVADENCFKSDRKTYQNVVLNHVQVLKEDNQLDKDIGDYMTIDIPKLSDEKDRVDTALVVEEAIRDLMPEKAEKILVVGLGNEDVTADALGPKVAAEIVVTSHLFRLEKEEYTQGCRNVSVLVPRVMGQTGMETATLVKAIVEEIKPDLVIAIDALATQSIERINRVIQITNTGIRPGAGVGNNRLAINEESLNVPVIAVGVATVVSVAALVYQVLHAIESKDIEKAEEYIDDSAWYQMVVTPKEMDEDVHHLVKIIAQGLNQAMHPRFSEF